MKGHEPEKGARPRSYMAFKNVEMSCDLILSIQGSD